MVDIISKLSSVLPEVVDWTKVDSNAKESPLEKVLGDMVIKGSNALNGAFGITNESFSIGGTRPGKHRPGTRLSMNRKRIDDDKN